MRSPIIIIHCRTLHEKQFGKLTLSSLMADSFLHFRFIQNVSDYKSSSTSVFKSLVRYNFTQIDQLIIFDRFKIFSFVNIDKPIQRLVTKLPDPLPKTVIKLLDYQGNHNIVQNIPQNLELNFDNQDLLQKEDQPLTLQNYKQLQYSVSEQLIGKVPEEKIRAVFKTAITNINQLKLRCEANYYVNFTDFITDFQTLINWNQIYRAKQISSYIWISAFVQLFNKLTNQTLKEKFYSKKADDLSRLMKFQTAFKVTCNNYPIVPTNFRQYQYIQQYVPTPKQRSQIIIQKMKSTKVPVQCSKDCDCLSTSQEPFCSFSLIQGTWQSKCKNRQNKIECCHSDPEDMKKCRNAEIKLKKGKSCRTNSEQQGQFDIQQCLIWGIDYYTRKNIIYSLPEKDVVNLKLRDNSNEKSDFVNSLLKAANYNSTQGYNIKKACEYIINNSPIYESTEENFKWKFTQNSVLSQIFSYKDRQYAIHLLKVLNLPGIDETGFRIHTKGKGARCLNKNGIKQSQFIVEYFGEIYELWRWFQRQDHTKKVMKDHKITSLPDFYNIYLEKHNDQNDGYDMLVVDPISHGNFASRFSHSCHPNCGTIITVSDGKYYIGMYALRNIEIGQELTFDYCSITESNLEHIQAICLCGTKICRGHYLQLGNAKQMNYVLDQYNCFLSRNSVLLHSCVQPFTQQDRDLLAKYNIKGNMLNGSPQWLKKWSAQIMKFVEFQGIQFKKAQLKKLQGLKFKDTEHLSQQQIEQKNQLFADVKKGDLFNVRFQNLITSIEKLRYYLGSIKDMTPPINIQSPETIFNSLWNVKKPTNKKQAQSIIFSIISHFQKSGFNRQISLIEQIDKYIQSEQNINKKLFLVRFGFLLLSQILKLNANQNTQLSDILYFYAFTHTYFTTHQFSSFDSQKMTLFFKDFLTEPSKLQNQSDTCKKQYSSQFVWGQLVAWFKQTIASPQSSLSQDRRGTLSYPTIESIAKTNSYPFDGHTRTNFFKTLLQKPFSSWPPDQCPWSYKNATKLYGTVLFESYFNSDKFKSLEVSGVAEQAYGKLGKRLIRCVLHTIDQPLNEKLNLFIQVQRLLSGIEQSEILKYKQLFWGQGYEDNKRELPPISLQKQQTKVNMKKQKVD